MACGGDLLHTHLPEPMQAVLAALTSPPDLVVADHGWAGAAVTAGLEVLAMADCNDPALFVAEHEGRLIGHAVGCALTRSRADTGLIRPDNAGFLGFAAVLPEGRGLGAGRAVGETVLAGSATAG